MPWASGVVELNLRMWSFHPAQVRVQNFRNQMPQKETSFCLSWLNLWEIDQSFSSRDILQGSREQSCSSICAVAFRLTWLVVRSLNHHCLALQTGQFSIWLKMVLFDWALVHWCWDTMCIRLCSVWKSDFFPQVRPTAVSITLQVSNTIF